MKELKVGERVTIEIVEVTTGSCEGCAFAYTIKQAVESLMVLEGALHNAQMARI